MRLALREDTPADLDVLVGPGAGPAIDGVEENLLPGDDVLRLEVYVEAGAQALQLLAQGRRLLPHDVNLALHVPQNVLDAGHRWAYAYSEHRRHFRVVWFYRYEYCQLAWNLIKLINLYYTVK